MEVEVKTPGLKDTPFEYVFPAIRGLQAKREYYVSMCPLRLLPKIFIFNEQELEAEVRAQRRLNKARLPEMMRYVIQNPETYTFSAITASIDGDIRFEPLSAGSESHRVGLLHISMDAKFVINDGQHRRAAIEMALVANPEIGDEHISVVFFLDRGLERCQQMFADLNRHAVRATTSLGVLYDHRDELAHLAKTLAFRTEAFRGLVELERSTLSLRSRRLFTLSALYSATHSLLLGLNDMTPDQRAEKAREFWDAVGEHFPEWRQVRGGQITAADVRREFIHSHGIVLQAIGRTGNVLLTQHRAWKARLKKLRTLDWSRSNSKLWEGRAMIGGRVSKAGTNVILTTNVIKKHLGVALSPEEDRVERNYLRGHHG